MSRQTIAPSLCVDCRAPLPLRQQRRCAVCRREHRLTYWADRKRKLRMDADLSPDEIDRRIDAHLALLRYQRRVA